MSDRISHKRAQRLAGDEHGLSCSVVARSTKDPSDGFVGHARPQRQPGVRIRGVP